MKLRGEIKRGAIEIYSFIQKGVDLAGRTCMNECVRGSMTEPYTPLALETIGHDANVSRSNSPSPPAHALRQVRSVSDHIERIISWEYVDKYGVIFTCKSPSR